MKKKSTLIIIVIVIFIGGLGWYLWENKQPNIPESEELPPISERVNPAPSSDNSLTVDVVNPGSTVTVASAKIAQSGYIAIKDESRVLLGSSSILTAGEHSGVTIQLQKPIVDGDVIYVVVQNESRADIEDEHGNVIEVQKNVGMVMSHYENEY